MIRSAALDVIRRAIADHWRRVWNFAFRMTLSRDAAEEVLEETYLRAYLGSERAPPEKTDRGPEVSFELLDEKLRSEPTRTDVVTSLTRPERNFYLWELKQGCMTSVVNCLPPGERVAFVLSVVLGYGDEDAAMVLGITTSAFKVRLSRARKKVTDYLAPRCEHVDPRNPCRCPSRLGVALTAGFLPRPPGSEVSLRPDFGRYGSTVDGEDAPLRDVMAIYQSLPDPDPPPGVAARLLRKLDSGEWNELLERAKASPSPR